MISRKPSYKEMSHEILARQMIEEFHEGQFSVAEITNLLIKAKDAYYNYGISIISDHVFDGLEKVLKQIVPDSDYFKKVGIEVRVTEWKKVAHKISMKSLNKVNLVEEFKKWASECETDDFIIEDKLDGGSIALEYENGNLVHAITRGDGLIGEDIVQNVKKMQGVKSKIEGLNGSLRGEIFILANDFETINSIKRKNGVKELSNPRNGAVGVCKGFDGDFTEYLTIYFYDIESEEHYFKTEFEKMEYLKSLGLKVCFYKKVSIEQAIKVFEDYEDHLRNETPYMIDGLVCKCNSNELLEKLGLIGSNYKGQVAWKFEASKAETVLENIEWSLGSNRRITPVANFKEILIGVKITNATLHNYDNFKNLKLGKGDRILISRNNDVIPALHSVIESKGIDSFKSPEFCPVCGHQTEIEGAYLICPNDLCQGLALGNLGRWINALKIMDIGDNIIEALYKAKRIATPADFYRLKNSDISTLERLGEKSATKILDHLKEKMMIDLPTFIDGLNIRNFRLRTAETLVQAGFNTIEQMQNATINELILIKGIQTKTAEAIISGLLNKKEIISDLLSVGITFKIQEKIQIKGNVLQNKSFCFTGAINRIDENGKRFSRDMMHKLVIENGGKIEESVKKGLSFLVMTDPSSVSSKAQKAKHLGTEILSEVDFFKKLGM